MFLSASYKLGIKPSDPPITPAIIRVGRVILKEKPRGIQICFTGIAQLVILAPNHYYIKVIVPRNKTFVSNSAKQCAAVDSVLNVVLLTDPVYLDKHFKQYHLKRTQFFR
jgi:hypothetical protein